MKTTQSISIPVRVLAVIGLGLAVVIWVLGCLHVFAPLGYRTEILSEFVLRYDPHGNQVQSQELQPPMGSFPSKVWERQWGSTHDDHALFVRALADHTLLLYGDSDGIQTGMHWRVPTGPGTGTYQHKDFRLMKLDAKGNVLWATPVRQCCFEWLSLCSWWLDVRKDGSIHLLQRDADGVFLSCFLGDGRKTWTRNLTPTILTLSPEAMIADIPKKWQIIGGVGRDKNGYSYIHLATLRSVKND